MSITDELMQAKHESFNKFYSELKERNYKSIDFIKFYLEGFVEIVLEDWHKSLFLIGNAHGEIENSSDEILFSVERCDNQGSTELGILSNGDIVQFSRETTLTGGVTWNGDDEYYDSYKTTFTVIEKLEESEMLSEFLNDEDITSESMEAIAVDIVSLVQDLSFEPCSRPIL